MGREESKNIKEKIAENDTGRKLEPSKMRNSPESDIRESLALSKLIDSDIKGGETEKGVEHATPVQSV